MPPSVAVLASPAFDPRIGRIETAAPIGSTLADIVALALPGAGPALTERFRVSIDDWIVPRDLWARVRPRAGTTVLVRAVPGDGDILRNVMSIAVAVGAVALGQFYGPILAGSLLGLSGAATGTLATALSAGITGTTLIAGTLLVNALVPVRTDEASRPSYAVQGLRNQATPDGVVPMVLGRIRIAPPYLMLPWTQAIGDLRYVTAGFVLGYGPLALSDWRIGETPIARFNGVTLEARAGHADDERLTLCPQQVIEEQLSVALTQLGPTSGPQSRFTASDCSVCSYDITFPGGLFAANKDGETEPFTVVITTRYRKVGDVTWTALPGLAITGDERKPIVRTFPITFPERGRYEVELTRLTVDWDDADQSGKEIQRTGRSVWSALRSFRPEYPVNFPHPLSVAAVKIVASGQLNGVVDELNVLAASLCPDWDHVTEAWVFRATSNPASLFRYVLTSNGNAYPLTVDEIGALVDWHDFCRIRGLEYNRYIAEDASLLDVLADIAAAGRASPYDDGERWGVMIDRAIDTVSAHVTPRNSWGFEWEQRYARFPDGFRVGFLDETNDYARAERIVPWPGFVGEPVRVEKLDLPGITNPDQVWREARRRQREAMLRRATYWVTQDFENFAAQRGDRVLGSFDVIDRVQIAARVVDVDGEVITLDEEVEMDEGQAYAIRFRRDNGSSLLRTVEAQVGRTRTLRLTGLGDAPQAGDLAMFGPSSQESRALTVKGIEAMEDMAARLTLVDHAPEIEELTDAETPPAWSGRAGGEAQEVTGTPLAPSIVYIRSGVQTEPLVTDEIPYPIAVRVRENPLNGVPVVTAQVRYRKVGVSEWTTSSAPVAAGSIIFGGYVKGDALEIQARLLSNLSTPSDWTETETHTVGENDPASPGAPNYVSATLTGAGGNIDHIWRAPDDDLVRSIRLSRTSVYGQDFADATQVGKYAVSRAQRDDRETSVGLGYFRFWIEALNSRDIASAPIGPKTVVRAVQGGNLLTSPYDFTNAAWTKSNVTAAAGATGPDGGGSSTIRETAASGTHYVSQTATITAGRHRAIIGIKADGRSRAQLRLGNVDLSSYASAVFNLSTEGIGTVNYTGSAVTNAVATLVRVSADYWLAMITADITGTGGALRLLTVNDANSASYAGDTTKGLGLWAASLAPA